MKKFVKSGLLPVITILAILITACDKASDPQSVLQLISSNGSNYVSDNRTLAGGTLVTTGVFAQAPSDNQTLAKFKVTFNYDSLDIAPSIVYLDSTLKSGTQVFSIPVTYTPRNLKGREIWKFIIIDSQGKAYERVVKLKTTSTVNIAKSVIYTYSNVILSRVKLAGQDSLGHISLSSETGTTFPYYVVKQPAITGKIDLTLNINNTDKPSLTTASLNANSLQNTTLKPADFDAIKNVANLKAAYPATGTGLTKLGSLKADQVIAYKTLLNKVGLLRIKAIKKNTVDSLLFDVKVEK